MLAAVLFACGHAPTPQAAAPSATPSAAETPPPTSVASSAPAIEPPPPQHPKTLPLPGATAPVTLDYIAYEPGRERVWIPVGDTGSVDVFDIASSTFTRVDGFAVAEREAHGKMRKMGPSAVTIGEGVAYVGDRAQGEVCVIDRATLTRGPCLKLQSATDGVAYVAPVKEIWVTTPHDTSLTILDATTPAAPKPKLVIKTRGEPEGYAVDALHGRFYTNLEDKNHTLGFDLTTHALVSDWPAPCGAEGPRGVAVDAAHNWVLVACTDSLHVLDAAHAGAVLGALDTGAGVDNIDYVPATRRVYVAANKAARLTIASIADNGQLSVIATVDTTEGARNAVADSKGNVYFAAPMQATFWVLPEPRAAPAPQPESR